MACLVGLRSHSQSHRGCCSTRTDPKYVGSSVFTESLRMKVGYTNSFSIRFFVNTYDTVHIIYRFLHTYFFSCTEVLSMQDLRFVLSPYVCMQAVSNPSSYVFFLYGGPKYEGFQVCTQSLRMYVGYIKSFSVRFFCTIEFLCMQVEQNIWNVNILLTCVDNRNDD